MNTPPARWRFCIDRGGTFTDIVATDPGGCLHTLKLLSDAPGQYEDAAVEGIRRLLGLAPGEAITAARVESVKMGTTVATNALLERKGEPTLLVTTRGFLDALRIAWQARPRLFDRRIQLPELLYSRVIEADERIGVDGAIVQALDETQLRQQLAAAAAEGFRSVAIVFMHAWQFPCHEQAAQRIARELGFAQISASHAVSPLIKLVSRGDTTVVDAYLSPVLHRYVDRVAACLPGVPLYFMQSSGSLTEAARFRGKDAILSGPAGGIVGMARSAAACGHARVIGFDMGGTSTDVSHFAGEFDRRFETEVAGVRVRAPMMNIHTVAAGGGSLLAFDGARLRVGPASAGARPGPASYGNGGPLALTDANLLLGRIQPDFFPRVFGPRGDAPLDRAAVVARFEALAAEVSGATGRAASAEELAEGFITIAVSSMAEAIKRISVACGHDVTRYTLACFGGAGGQHACRVADALGMERVFVHPLAGVLSAWGMGIAGQGAMRERSIELPFDETGIATASGCIDALLAEASAELLAQGAAAERIAARRHVHLRYAGTDTALAVDLGTPADMSRDFETSYRQRFAFLLAGRSLVIEGVAVEATVQMESAGEDAATGAETAHEPAPAARVPFHQDGWREVALFVREQLRAGATIAGPAIIAERNATTVVEPGWRATVGASGALELARHLPRTQARAAGTDVDPVLLEVFNNLFMNIAEQMGLRLQNTAHSVNIKERLDFSCALFDSAGRLIANAPHMPVHLGSMSESIRSVIERNPAMQAGDVYALNDPYHGGTHLPDVTVVTPVYLEPGDERPAFFVASRGHHADIGGITPGSMPPFSTSIAEEGVLIDNLLLLRDGVLREAALGELLAGGSHPARNPAQNLADLRAQIAANAKGAEELHALVAEYGRATVDAYMRHVRANAAECVRRVIGVLRDGSCTLELDNGARIMVALRVDHAQRSATIDFSGTSAQLDNNFNAPKAVTTAAVLYVFRTLVDDDIPLNAGCLEPLQIIVPEGCMLNPRSPAAVVAGNVETSMCVSNALYGALGVMAASQCTMNNFTFGDATHQYYETIAGGSGAGPGFAGTSVVQTHMTNSRLTDPEVLESRFPVRLESYAIRAGSGGAGQFRGGDGGVRRLRFLAPMSASILSNGRRVPAFGGEDGLPGALGANRIERADGRIEELGHIGSAQLEPGDVFVIETPGGGGWGKP